MSELQKPWGDRESIFDWYYSDENDREIVMPIGNNTTGINIILALNAIHYYMTEEEYDAAEDHLLDLAEILIGNAYDLGDKIAHELQIKQFNSRLDDELRDILLEGDTPTE
jgi:protein involved in sex pheromone biosynthesis